MIRKIIINNYKGVKSANINFNDITNIIVGNNGVGKSTIIEAMSLVLGYGLNQLEITPNLFHKSTWVEFENNKILPEILIEIFFQEKPDLAQYSGKNHSLRPSECIGIRLRIIIDEDYIHLFDAEKADCKHIPCEYYKIERYWFSDAPVKQLTIPYAINLIDSTSTYFNSRTNQYVSKLIQSKLSDEEKIKMKGGLRKMKQNFEEHSDIILINKSLSEKTKEIQKDFSISVDLTTKNAWNTIMCPIIEDIPINQIGLGDQCILKTLLSLDENKENKRDTIIIVEEPESHLSHTKMYELLKYLSERKNGQLFVTTHNNFVANKLELNNLILLNSNAGEISDSRINMTDLDIDVFKYFFKTCNYPTLRLALCKKAILVEGPTDEMVITYYYKTKYNKHPFDDGIELISVDGVSFKHFVQLALSLNIQMAIITDNDGRNESDVIDLYVNDENKGFIKVFTEKDILLHTLEPSFVNINIERLQDLSDILRKKKVKLDSKDLLSEFMINNKTEWAYRLLSSIDNNVNEFDVPNYIVNAINWLNGK